MNEERKVINISEVLHLMSIGYTRTKDGWGSTNYDPNIGSIEEYYGLVNNSVMTANQQVKALFQHPKLKKAKTKVPVVLPFTLVDDTEVTETATTATPTTTEPTGYTDDAEVNVVNEFERTNA